MDDEDFEININNHGEFKVIHIKGALRSLKTKIFRDHGDRLIDEGARFAVDLEDMNYIDSAGIGALIAVDRALKAVGRNLILIKPNAGVRRTIKLIKMDTVFKIIETIDDLSSTPL